MVKQIVFHPASEATQPNVEQDQMAQRKLIETRSVQSLAVQNLKSFLYLPILVNISLSTIYYSDNEVF